MGWLYVNSGFSVGDTPGRQLFEKKLSQTEIFPAECINILLMESDRKRGMGWEGSKPKIDLENDPESEKIVCSKDGISLTLSG